MNGIVRNTRLNVNWSEIIVDRDHIQEIVLLNSRISTSKSFCASVFKSFDN